MTSEVRLALVIVFIGLLFLIAAPAILEHAAGVGPEVAPALVEAR